jgi:hypothetical protein
MPARLLTAAVACGVTLSAAALVQPPADLTPHKVPLAPVPKPDSAAGPKFVVFPYLQFATRTSITVMCETDLPTTAVVEYGPTFPPQLRAESSLGTLHEVKLGDLAPGAKHFYRVVCRAADGRELAGPPGTFQTAVGEADAYSFCVVGDTQRNPVVTAKLAKLMWDRRPHFVLHMGDVVDDGADLRQWVHDLFTPCRELFARVPVYPCIGNHEKDHAHYYRYFSLPAPEHRYSFRYGNAEFFSLDTNRPAGPGSAQHDWLDQALAGSNATWKVCYHHHPCYSSDENDYGDAWKGESRRQDRNAAKLIPLYEKHGVDLGLNGHIHLYERTWPVRAGKVDRARGVTYVTSGGGGGGLEAFEPTPAFFKNQGRVSYHYCHVTVSGDVMDWRVYDVDDRLFDQFTLTKGR